MTILVIVSLTLFGLLCLSIRQNSRLSEANKDLAANINIVKDTGMTWFQNEAKGIAEREADEIAGAFTADASERRKLGAALTERIMMALLLYFVTSGRQNRLMREAAATADPVSVTVSPSGAPCPTT